MGDCDNCPCLFSFFPCSSVISGNLFLTACLGYILAKGSFMIADGMEHLTKLSSAAVVSGVLLPFATTLPDICIILYSGFATDIAVVQEEVLVAVGSLAGSTAFLLTVAMAIGVIQGRCDISDFTGTAIDRTLHRHGTISLTRTGVTFRKNVEGPARWMALTSLPYLLSLAPPLFFKYHYEQASKYFLRASFIFAVLGFFGFAYEQVTTGKPIREKLLRQARHHLLVEEAVERMRQYVIDAQNRLHVEEEEPYEGEEDPLLCATRKCVAKWKKLVAERRLAHGHHRSECEPGGNAIVAAFTRSHAASDPLPSTPTAAAPLPPTSAEVVHERDQLLGEYRNMLNEKYGSADSIAVMPALPAGLRRRLSGQSSVRRRSSAALLKGRRSLSRKESVLTDEADEEHEHEVQSAVMAMLTVLVGTLVVSTFTSPMVDTINKVAKLMHVPAFLVAFVVLPIITSMPELVVVTTFASRKKSSSMSLVIVALCASATINNTVCLALLLGIVNFRPGVEWNFVAELFSIVFIELVFAGVVLSRRTIRLWMGLAMGAMFVVAIGLVVFLESLGLR